MVCLEEGNWNAVNNRLDTDQWNLGVQLKTSCRIMKKGSLESVQCGWGVGLETGYWNMITDPRDTVKSWCSVGKRLLKYEEEAFKPR